MSRQVLFLSTAISFLLILLSYSLYQTHNDNNINAAIPMTSLLLASIFPSKFPKVSKILEDGTRSVHMQRKSHEPDHVESDCYTLAIVTDLDLESKLENEDKWYSNLRFLKLLRDDDLTESSQEATTDSNTRKYQVQELYEKSIYSEWNRKRRSMELSALVHSDEKLYAFCDITGLVYEIDKNPLTATPKYILTVGRNSSFKSEWATVKGEEIIVGSIGKEWVVDEKPGHLLLERIQRINLNTGEIRSESWHDNFWKLREVANATWPGYMIHEGAVWHPQKKKWYFLPRKVSHDTIYSEEADETMGSNIMLIASEDFTEVETRRIGPLENEYGFSDFELLYDEVFVALKVRERADGGTDTKLIVFDASTGEMLSDWHDLGHLKYEGIATLSSSCESKRIDW